MSIQKIAQLAGVSVATVSRVLNNSDTVKAKNRERVLQAIKESIQPGQDWLFPGRSSGHLSTKTMLRTIDRLAEEAGIQVVSRKHKLS